MALSLPAWFVRRPDGRFDVRLDPDLRTAVAIISAELAQAIEDDPTDEQLRRLHPPAYPDDPERDLEYQLLAGEELRSSQRAAVEATLEIVQRDVVDADDLWSLMRTLNGVRLAAGTRLGIEDDDHRPPPRWAMRFSPQKARDWEIYELAGLLQYAAIRALQDDEGELDEPGAPGSSTDEPPDEV